MPPLDIDWKLRNLLEREGVTVYALAKKLGENMDKPLNIRTLYRWTNDTPSNPGLEGIAWVLWALGELTGKTFTVTDVLEFHERRGS